MWEYPWISDEDMASDLADEEFLKRGSGDKKISITLPINWIEELDIFSNFKHQDPYGIDPGDEGEREHYYYVESIAYNWMEGTMTITGADLTYILRQCMIIGRCSEMPEGGWPDATEWQRMFGFIADCTTEAFPDGEPAKRICKCCY
jgi:hypothetical protein